MRQIWRPYSQIASPDLIRGYDSFAFFHNIETVRRKVLQDLSAAGRPANLNPIDFVRGPQSKMHPQVILREIAAAAANLIDLGERACNHSHLRTQTESVAARADELNCDPVVGTGPFIVENHGRTVDVFDHNIDSAIVIEIPKRRAPTGLWDGHGSTDGIADIGERAIPLVQEHEFALTVLRPRDQRVDLGVYVSVD